MRWIERFKSLASEEAKSSDKSHAYYDTMYACFQNIFFLKDWLIHETELNSADLTAFISSNKEIGICRDICNGTKHYNITNPSVDSEFGVIRQYNPYHLLWNIPEWEIIICAGGNIYEPYDLIIKCVEAWDLFIFEKLKLEKKKQFD